MRQLGIKLGSLAWEASALTSTPQLPYNKGPPLPNTQSIINMANMQHGFFLTKQKLSIDIYKGYEKGNTISFSIGNQTFYLWFTIVQHLLQSNKAQTAQTYQYTAVVSRAKHTQGSRGRFTKAFTVVTIIVLTRFFKRTIL